MQSVKTKSAEKRVLKKYFSLFWITTRLAARKTMFLLHCIILYFSHVSDLELHLSICSVDAIIGDEGDRLRLKVIL